MLNVPLQQLFQPPTLHILRFEPLSYLWVCKPDKSKSGIVLQKRVQRHCKNHMHPRSQQTNSCCTGLAHVSREKLSLSENPPL